MRDAATGALRLIAARGAALFELPGDQCDEVAKACASAPRRFLDVHVRRDAVDLNHGVGRDADALRGGEDHVG